MAKITKEIAAKSAEEFLTSIRFKDRLRDKRSDDIETLIYSIMDGEIIFDKDKGLTQILRFPLKNDEGVETVKELNYIPRVSVGKVNLELEGISSKKPMDMMVGYAAAYTGQVKPIIRALDSSTDYKVMTNILGFIM